MEQDEQKLYDKFLNVLNNRLDSEPSAQDLAVVLNFLKYNNIQASSKHKGVSALTKKVDSLLPFEEDSDLQPIRRIK